MCIRDERGAQCLRWARWVCGGDWCQVESAAYVGRAGEKNSRGLHTLAAIAFPGEAEKLERLTLGGTCYWISLADGDRERKRENKCMYVCAFVCVCMCVYVCACVFCVCVCLLTCACLYIC